MSCFGGPLDSRRVVTSSYQFETFSGQLVKRRGAVVHGRVFQRKKETWIQREDVVSDNLLLL